ncbi:MAG: hypothetical protein PVG57_06470 [Gammaproteobacteria bacterium]|nr:MAG: hypothetical protein AMJ59_16045 [Gammaproteobacteria bacterium SG8_31]
MTDYHRCCKNCARSVLRIYRDKNFPMVSGQHTADTESARQETISLVAQKALLFGEFSAKAAGHQTFEDPVMHTYFLHYVFGAIKALAGHSELSARLSEDDTVNAMGIALMSFENSSREEVLSTLKMLYRAKDEAAVRIQEEGRQAAEAWNWGENRDAVFRFVELMRDPANFPREVEPSPSLKNGQPDH